MIPLHGGTGKLCSHCSQPVPVDHGSPEECIKALKTAVEIERVTAKAATGIPVDQIAGMTTQTARALRDRLGNGSSAIVMVGREGPTGAEPTSFFYAYRGPVLLSMGLLETCYRRIRMEVIEPPARTDPPAAPPSIEKP